jgi:16S rRNA processing protein RimM
MSERKDLAANGSVEQPVGQLAPNEPEFLVIGKLRRPHGLRGEMLMDVLTDFPERLVPGATVFLGEEHQPQRISGLRSHDQALLVTIAGFPTPDEVSRFRNHLVYVRVDDRPVLPEGEYYHHQLLGLKVVQDSGETLGIVSEILITGANDVYVVRPEDGPEILLPAIAEVVREIDLAQGLMVVHLLPGLID